MAEPERLQKLLARSGFGSRRAAEALIAAGRVSVDGVIATLGMRADPEGQRIEVDGRGIELARVEATLVLHKPRGFVVTASDEHGRPTVYELLPDAPAHLRYVGRLDEYSEGLLLLTTDGELAHRLTHPRWAVEKIYEATLDAEPGADALAALRRGVALDDGPTAPATVTLLPARPDGSVVVRVAIHEGRNRHVRRMFEAVGCRVARLVRVQFGPVRLGALAPGESRALGANEVHALRAQVGLASDR